MITLAQLMACTGAREDRASISLPAALDAANSAMDVYAINTRDRIGMFLANVGHETGGLHWIRESWGPTPAQLRYEGRADLGNTKPGDGERYMGRGWLQTTGRANYAALRDRLRKRGVACPDFVAAPEALEQPEWGALSAADFADMKHLNDLADRGAFTDYCIRVNGGLNGIEERTALWRTAREVLA